MIKEQYYTRERGGLFSNHDGYDSIARSPDLSLDFIKKNIHPLCNYEVPSQLGKHVEEEEDKYPPNFIIMPISTGELVVGQAVYKSKDFTGLRSTFFMHNYIFDEEDKLEVIKTPEKLFGITRFVKAYDVNFGQELSSLREVPYEGEAELFRNRNKLFSELGITEDVFKKLLYAIFMAAGSKKKVYIALDVPVTQLGEYAKALLYHLYKHLPWSVIKDLGLSTYSRTMEAKKNMHILFIEKSALKIDAKAEKEFVFDFVNRRFLNVGCDVSSAPYLEFALNYANEKELWKAFNVFAEQILIGMKETEEKNLDFYNHLAVLFEMDLYRKSQRDYLLALPRVRQHLLSQTLMYMQLNIAPETKEQLRVLMTYAIQQVGKAIKQHVLLERDEVTAILRFNKLFKCNSSGTNNIEQEKQRIVQLMLQDLEEALALNQYDAIREVLHLLSEEKAIYTSVFEGIYNDLRLRREIGYRFIEERFIRAMDMKSFRRVLEEILPLEQILLRDDQYKKTALSTLGQCMYKKEPHEVLVTVQKWQKEMQSVLSRDIVEAGEAYFLKNIDLKRLPSEDTLCKLSFSKAYEDKQYHTICAYKAIKENSDFMHQTVRHLEPGVQELIKLFYQKEVKKEAFCRVVYAFLQMTKDEYGYDLAQLNLGDALRYLYGISVETTLDFIIWSRGKETHINQMIFEREVTHFFQEVKKQEGALPKELLKEKLSKHPKTRHLYESIKISQQSAIRRYISNHSRGLGCVSCLLIASLGVLAYFHMSKGESVKLTASKSYEGIGKSMSDLGSTKIKKIIAQKQEEIAAAEELAQEKESEEVKIENE